MMVCVLDSPAITALVDATAGIMCFTTPNKMYVEVVKISGQKPPLSYLPLSLFSPPSLSIFH